jgi:Zn-dependent protease
MTATRQRGFRLGRVRGIEIRLDWSLLFIFALITVNLGAGLFPAQHPTWAPALAWGTALAAALLFLASVLAHELAHALMGQRQGVPVERITLFIFGGMAELRAEPQSPRAELAITIVGPLTSLAIGIGALLLGGALIQTPPDPAEDPRAFIRSLGPVPTLLFWLGPVNVLLALFNLIPGFPLDGGRVLRALLWRTTGDFEKATRWSAAVGRGFGLTLMFVGALMLFGWRVPLLGRGPIQGLWLVFIGWFLSSAALASYRQVVIRRMFQGVTVARLMWPARRLLEPSGTLQEAADAFLDEPGDRCLPVVDEGELVGLVCLSDLGKAPRTDWPQRHLGEVMTPREALVTVVPEEPVTEALQKLARADVDQLPVLAGSELRGFLRRADVIRWLELRGEDR